MFSRLSLAAGAIAGGFVALLVTQTVNALWIIPAAREEGRNSNAPNWIPQPTKQLENCEMKLIALALTAARALSAAGCTSTQQVSASKDRLNQAARAVVGTSLIGARANFEPTLHSVLDGCIERVHNLGQLALCLLLFGGLRERINVGHWLSPLSTPGLPYEDGVTVSVVTLPAAHFRCEQKDALPFAKAFDQRSPVRAMWPQRRHLQSTSQHSGRFAKVISSGHRLGPHRQPAYSRDGRLSRWHVISELAALAA